MHDHQNSGHNPPAALGWGPSRMGCAKAGGSCACATCHIHVDSVWCDKLEIKQNSLEQSLLEYEPDYIEGVSRLACQIQLNDDLNNVTVKLRKHELL